MHEQLPPNDPSCASIDADSDAALADQHFGPYCTFPICLLNFSDDWKQTVNHILDYCIVETGRKMMPKLEWDDDEYAEMAEEDGTAGYRDTTACKEVIAGLDVLGLRQGSCSLILKQHKAVRDFLMFLDMELFNPNILCRANTELLMEQCSGGGLSRGMFKCLCAVKSIIGSKKYPCCVRRKLVAARMLGFISDRVAEGEEAVRWMKGKKLQLPTNAQVRRLLDKLELREFYTRCQVSPRRTLFATGMTPDAIRQWVKAGRRKRDSIKERRQADRAALKGNSHLNSNSRLNSVATEMPVKASIQSAEPQPPDSHTAAANVATTIATKIDTGEIESGEINTVSNRHVVNGLAGTPSASSGGGKVVCSHEEALKQIAKLKASLAAMPP